MTDALAHVIIRVMRKYLTTPAKDLLLLACLGYIVLIIYGTLYPLTGWQLPHGIQRSDAFLKWPKYLTRSDIITNLVIYVPFGALLAILLKRHFTSTRTVLLVFICGFFLSLTLEYIQFFLPGRVTSLVDILLNSGGALLGALIPSLIYRGTRTYTKLFNIRHQWFNPRDTTELGIAVILLWVASQIFPLIPTFDLKLWQASLLPVRNILSHPEHFDYLKTCLFALNITALSIIYTTLTHQRRPAFILFVVFIFSVIMLKVPVINHKLYLEDIAGLMLGIAIFATLYRLRLSTPIIAILSLVLAYALGTLVAEQYSSHIVQTINWIPFRGQVGRINGMIEIIKNLWPFAAMAYLTLHAHGIPRPDLKRRGTLAIFIMVMTIEMAQQYIPGRYPDITDVLVATAGWLLAWSYYQFSMVRDKQSR